jgi:hypothetical protein
LASSLWIRTLREPEATRARRSRRRRCAAPLQFHDGLTTSGRHSPITKNPSFSKLY